MPGIVLKRAYEKPSRGDGFRVLVDRLWPRGVSKDELQLDAWAKTLAPSTELRKWFAHDQRNGRSFASVTAGSLPLPTQPRRFGTC